MVTGLGSRYIDRSVSGEDLANVIRLSDQYDLPFGRGRRFTNQGVTSKAVGGFTAGAFFTIDDGAPVRE